MLYYLSNLSDKVEFLSFFRLFDSIMFRSISAMITTLLISLIFGKPLIDFLYKKGMRDIIRDYSNVSSKGKAGTPTMGGILIILSMIISILFWSDLSSIFVIFSLLAIIWFGGIGFYDDYMKVKYKDSDKGLSQKKKIFLQFSFALLISIVYYFDFTSPFSKDIVTQLSIPFVKNNYSFDLGIWYIPFSIFIVLSISNAVNFADGLDGLSIVPSVITALVYGVFAYIIGNMNWSEYLLFNYVESMGELTVIASAFFGAGLGFLWFNSYPATVFMGDTGSMAIGGLLSVFVISTKQELIFIIAGGIFVFEAFSVLVQQKIGINRIGRRIFFSAPIHHTFQEMGIAETKIVQRFWIVSIILALLSLATIKIR